MSCKLINLGSVAYADTVQLLLGLLAILSLLFKRYIERPQRTCHIWLLDVSKQATGGIFAHFLNIAMAIYLSSLQSTGGQCAWYFINYTIDTTIGIIFAWFYFRIINIIAHRLNWTSLKHTGDYHLHKSYIAISNRVNYRIWGLQLLAWVIVIALTKFTLLGFIYLAISPLNSFAVFFKDLFTSPKVELLVVMICCPLLMNAIQFWIFDTFLKKKTSTNPSANTESQRLITPENYGRSYGSTYDGSSYESL